MSALIPERSVFGVALVGAGAGFVAAGAGAGAAAGAAAAADFVAGAAVSAVSSSVRISVPWDTLSPGFRLSAFIVPADGEGMSIVALSDSSVTSESSLFTTSPGLTNTSITGMFLKSPISGTLTSTILLMGFLNCCLKTITYDHKAKVCGSDQPRTWPSPNTTYFSEVRPSSPTGPRACSLSVEMPISAPRPYS